LVPHGGQGLRRGLPVDVQLGERRFDLGVTLVDLAAVKVVERQGLPQGEEMLLAIVARERGHTTSTISPRARSTSCRRAGRRGTGCSCLERRATSLVAASLTLRCR
jgi:hypothetical protein